MKFRPCIDIHRGRVKQIVGSTLKDDINDPVENFVSKRDADYYAEMFYKDSLYGGHVIMLGPGNEEQAVKAIKAFPGGLQVGGGINENNAAFYLEQGASHVIVTSYVFSNGEINMNNLKKIEEQIGRERLVIDLSCKKKDDEFYVVTDRWQKYTDFKVGIMNLSMLSAYCDEFLIHAVDAEGKQKGILTDLVKMLGQYDGIPVTYAGGIKSMQDIEEFYTISGGKLDLTIGSALDIYGGCLSYGEVIKYMHEKN